MTREQFAERIRIGHNLGNALECIEPVYDSAATIKIDRAVTDKNGYHDHRIIIQYPDGTYSYFYNFDEIWSNAPVTEDFFKILADIGVQLVRIPMNLSGHIIDDNNTVDPLWLKKIRSVVEMCINNDMVANLCLHTDFVKYYRETQFESLFDLQNDPNDDAVGVLMSVWKQMAEYVNDIPVDVLCFELTNEFRIHDMDDDLSHPNGRVLTFQEKAMYAARLNKYLFDAVRSVGGNAAKRFLLIENYANCADMDKQTYIESFKNDFDSRCLMTACYYCPWEFTVCDRHNTWELNSAIKPIMEREMNRLKYIREESGVPLVITEYGVGCDNSGMEHKDKFSICRYLYTVMKMMKNEGFPAFIWDPGYIIKRIDYHYGIPFWREMLRGIYFGEPFDLYESFTEHSEHLLFTRHYYGVSRTAEDIRALDDI